MKNHSIKNHCTKLLIAILIISILTPNSTILSYSIKDTVDSLVTEAPTILQLLASDPEKGSTQGLSSELRLVIDAAAQSIEDAPIFLQLPQEEEDYLEEEYLEEEYLEEEYLEEEYLEEEYLEEEYLEEEELESPEPTEPIAPSATPVPTAQPEPLEQQLESPEPTESIEPSATPVPTAQPAGQENKAKDHIAPLKRATSENTWIAYQPVEGGMIRLVWENVTIPAKTKNEYIKQGYDNCYPVSDRQDVWVDKWCTEYQDVWVDKWCTEYQDVWINYWKDNKGNWGGGHYERQSKQVYCGRYERQTKQVYCGRYETKYISRQQCDYKDTSYWKEIVIEPERTEKRLVSHQRITYAEYEQEIATASEPPRIEIGIIPDQTTRLSTASQPPRSSLLDPSIKPTHLDLSRCSGGELEFVEYLWIYTGKCEPRDDQKQEIERLAQASQTLMPLGIAQVTHYVFLPPHVLRSQTKKARDFIKEKVQETFDKIKKIPGAYDVLKGLIDSIHDEIESYIEIISSVLDYLCNLAIMLYYYVVEKNQNYIQPFLNDIQNLGSDIVSADIKTIVNQNLQGIYDDMVNRWEEEGVCYSIGYYMGTAAILVFSPGKYAKAIQKIGKKVNIVDEKKIKSQIASKETIKNVTSVEYGKHYKKVNNKKKLEPNVKYTCPNGYTYYTDHLGRITYVEGDLKLNPGHRNANAQNQTRVECSDHAGHLIACRFGGSGDIDNLVSMDANLNQGKFKKLENKWANALKEGKTVQVKITPIYDGDSVRPVRFEILHKTGDGGWEKQEFQNKAGG